MFDRDDLGAITEINTPQRKPEIQKKRHRRNPPSLEKATSSPFRTEQKILILKVLSLWLMEAMNCIPFLPMEG